MAIERNPVNGDLTVSWPARITLRQCPDHGLVEQEFLEVFSPDPDEADLCVVPTYQEVPCHEPLSEERVEYLHPLHVEMWRDALLDLFDAVTHHPVNGELVNAAHAKARKLLYPGGTPDDA